MQMLSTRGAAAVSPSMAIMRGLAPDGGLYGPAEFPSFTSEEIRSLAKVGYQERAAFVLGRFLPLMVSRYGKSCSAMSLNASVGPCHSSSACARAPTF